LLAGCWQDRGRIGDVTHKFLGQRAHGIWNPTAARSEQPQTKGAAREDGLRSPGAPAPEREGGRGAGDSSPWQPFPWQPLAAAEATTSLLGSNPTEQRLPNLSRAQVLPCRHGKGGQELKEDNEEDRAYASRLWGHLLS
jgi:hypothetical protein